MDGSSLSNLLHKRGVNIRYIGEVAKLADKDDPRLQALRELAVQEMICRGFKHVANRQLRGVPHPFAPACISHLLNCLLGSDLNPTPEPSIDSPVKALYPDSDFGFEAATPGSIRAEVAVEVKIRYRYDIENALQPLSKHQQILRSVALKLGLQLRAKDYSFTKGTASKETPGSGSGSEGNSSASENPHPKTNGHANGVGKGRKKKKLAGRQTQQQASSPQAPTTFSPDDFFNVVPVVKEASPRVSSRFPMYHSLLTDLRAEFTSRRSVGGRTHFPRSGPATDRSRPLARVIDPL